MLRRTFLGIVIAVAPLSLRAQAPATFSLAPGEVTEAVIDASGRMKVLLTPEKSEELATFTARNVNRQGRFVVAGKLRSEPFIRERMTGPWLELYVASSADALATVKALLPSARYTWTDSAGTHYSDRPPPADAAPPAPVADARSLGLLQELQGSWVVKSATMNGEESGDPGLLQGHWRFQGSELVLYSPGKGSTRFAVRPDPKAEPKAFHVSALAPANAGTGWMLFAREGSALKIAFHDNLGSGRPTGFAPRPAPAPKLVVVILVAKQ